MDAIPTVEGISWNPVGGSVQLQKTGIQFQGNLTTPTVLRNAWKGRSVGLPDCSIGRQAIRDSGSLDGVPYPKARDITLKG